MWQNFLCFSDYFFSFLLNVGSIGVHDSDALENWEFNCYLEKKDEVDPF